MIIDQNYLVVKQNLTRILDMNLSQQKVFARVTSKYNYMMVQDRNLGGQDAQYMHPCG